MSACAAAQALQMFYQLFVSLPNEMEPNEIKQKESLVSKYCPLLKSERFVKHASPDVRKYTTYICKEIVRLFPQKVVELDSVFLTQIGDREPKVAVSALTSLTSVVFPAFIKYISGAIGAHDSQPPTAQQVEVAWESFLSIANETHTRLGTFLGLTQTDAKVTGNPVAGACTHCLRTVIIALIPPSKKDQQCV